MSVLKSGTKALLFSFILTSVLCAAEDRREAAIRQIAETALTDGLVEELLASGLADSDAHTIAANFSIQMVTCIVDEYLKLSAERAISYDSALGALELAIVNEFPSDSDFIVNIAEVEKRALPCAYGVAQEAGVELPLTDTT